MTALVLIAFLASASTIEVSQDVLTPTWSTPLGKGARLLAAEEYGRCFVIAEGGVLQVLRPDGEVAWRWNYSRLNRLIDPQQTAVSPDCDAIATTGSATYKHTWIADRAGSSVAVGTESTPADAAFDRTGKLVAVGTFGGTLELHTRDGGLLWKRKVTQASLIQDLEFSDDNTKILFKGFGGAGIVDLYGHQLWATLASQLSASRDLNTLAFYEEPSQGSGEGMISVTDGARKMLWRRVASLGPLVSDSGHRILAHLDGGVALMSREGVQLRLFPEYLWHLALSGDATRMWLANGERMVCTDDEGNLLATIGVADAYRNVFVSRDFAQVIVVNETYGRRRSVDRYDVPAPCRQ